MTFKHILYLASGSSRRFGTNKLLTPLEGKSLYLHSLEMLCNLVKDREDCRLTVVSRYEEIRKNAQAMGIQTVHSPESEKGASYTIKAGLSAVRGEEYILFVVADQPYLTAASVEKLLTLADGETVTASLSCNGTPGNPVLFHPRLIPELQALEGDRGGRAVVRNHPCTYVEAEAKELRDIDYPRDL